MSMLDRTWKDTDMKSDTLAKDSIEPSQSKGLDQQHLSALNANSSQDAGSAKPGQLNLAAKHKKILRATFIQLNSGGTFLKLMEQVFRRLEAKYPDIRSIFLTTAFVNSLTREKSSPPLVRTEHDHCKCLVSLFEKIMDNLNGDDIQVNPIRSYGEKHAQMKESGMSADMIEHFGEIAVAVIASQDVVKYNQEAVKAWRMLLAYITDELMVGFDRISRMSERKCSGADHCLRRT